MTLPAIWNLPVDKGFEQWNVVGLFNWKADQTTITINPMLLGLSKKKTYLLYELWSDRFLGEFTGDRTFTLSSTSSNIFTVHERKIIRLFFQHRGTLCRVLSIW